MEKEDLEIADSTDRSVKSAEEARLVSKLDWRLMPILWVMYWFNYLDRNAITVARLDGLEAELNLTSTQYQTSVAILFVGYILGQVPSSLFNPSSVVTQMTRTNLSRHAHYPRPPIYLHGRRYGSLGCRQYFDRCDKGL